jgi:hypothetical protein
MRSWKVMGLATVSVALLLAGLAALMAPAQYEGPVLLQLGEDNTVRLLDGVGAALIAMGSITAWGAGVVWQRRVYAP